MLNEDVATQAFKCHAGEKAKGFTSLLPTGCFWGDKTNTISDGKK